MEAGNLPDPLIFVGLFCLIYVFFKQAWDVLIVA